MSKSKNSPRGRFNTVKAFWKRKILERRRSTSHASWFCMSKQPVSSMKFRDPFIFLKASPCFPPFHLQCHKPHWNKGYGTSGEIWLQLYRDLCFTGYVTAFLSLKVGPCPPWCGVYVVPMETTCSALPCDRYAPSGPDSGSKAGGARWCRWLSMTPNGFLRWPRMKCMVLI